MYDFCIVGAGMFGSVFAEQATAKGFSCLVIDKRDHIGGNCYTESRGDYHQHMYGPHIFHTNDDEIWQYINRFSRFNRFSNRVKAKSGNTHYSFPLNLMTFQQLWGCQSAEEVESELQKRRIKFSNPSANLESWMLSQVGEEIYTKFVKGYTKKQWKKDPKDLPASIIKRLPIRTDWNDDYFDDKYQGIPEDGYTKIFEKMLEKSTVQLGVDFFENREYYKSISKKIIFTGMIDQYYEYCFGKLEYRRTHFHHSEIDEQIFLGNAVVNYCDEEIPYTRITEHKYFSVKPSKSETTWITHEFPVEDKDEYIASYPINDEKNTALYQKYKELSKQEQNVYFGGRLAAYQYRDMHQIIAEALKLSEKLLK